MQTPDKLEFERHILERIYDPSQFEIVHTDSPDFLLARKGNRPFGVEVTELFPTESHARMLHVPDYMRSLWEGGEYVHKDDKAILNVVRVEVSDQDGNVKAADMPGIITDVPGVASHYDRLAEVVERKNAAFAHYETNLDHVNLLIADHFDAQSSIQTEFSNQDILPPRMRTALLASPFRSVIVINHFGYDGSRYVELDVLWLLEAFKVMMEAIAENKEVMTALDGFEVAALCYEALIAENAPVTFRQSGDFAMVWFGNFGIAYQDDRGIVIYDQSDWELPPEIEVPAYKLLTEELKASVVKRFSEMHATYVLTSELSMAVRAIEPAADL